MTTPKRRLPVLQSKVDEGEPRPPWHWSAIGGIATLLAFVPLAAGAASLARRTYERNVAGSDPAAIQAALQAMTPGDRMLLGALVVLGPIVALALASFGGGVLVGRFGGAAGKREAAVAGLFAAAVSSALAARDMVERPEGPLLWLFTSAVLFACAGIFAFFGGLVGLRLRRRG
ncbi:MAG: hypothetical protein FJ096_06740 [Deltaproteobacteria bacterium]|nr:hypothetical protein [Deltaproteobacteria bacterium]